MVTDSATAEPSPQTEGYLILLRPQRAYADYAAEMDRISPDRPAHDAPHAARLNANMLFSTFAEAAEFRSWYRTQGWSEAEGEPGDFCIARIDRVAT